MQRPLFNVAGTDWSPPRIADLPSWDGAKRIGFDVETYNPDMGLGPAVRRGGYICGYSVAIEDGPAFYVPLRHLGGQNVEDPDAALGYLREQAAGFEGIVAGCNLPYDLDFAKGAGVEFGCAEFRDVQIADALCCELHHSYSLESIAERWGVPGKAMDELEDACEAYGITDPRSGIHKLPGGACATYGISDVVAPLRILRKQERVIDEKDLWQAYGLENALLPVLLRMTWRGVRIDQTKLAQIERWSHGEEQKALDAVRHITGVAIKAGDTKKLRPLERALRHQGIKVPRAPKGGASIKNEWLKMKDDPVAQHLWRARKLGNLRTTFVKSIRDHMTNGRIHCTFNQSVRTKDENAAEETKGVRYGRLSAQDPNLQQQPIRDEWGPMWRSIYLPDEGGEWLAADYGQQEPRWVTHYAARARCRGAAAAVRYYNENPNDDPYSILTSVIYGGGYNKRQRDDVKQIFLALCYGMGEAALCRKLGYPTRWEANPKRGRPRHVADKEGAKVLSTFHRQVPFVRQFSWFCNDVAKARGYVRVLMGRRLHFPLKDNGQEFDFTRKACNRVAQGSSAIQCKKALVMADRAGYRLQLQVHDELLQTVSSRKEGAGLANVMREAVECDVRHKVDEEYGPSWGEVKAA